MSILHAKCEKEIAELKQQHNNDKSNIKELNAKLKKGNKELAALKKEATSLNEKLENLEYDLEKQNILKEDIVKLKEDIVNKEKQLENLNKPLYLPKTSLSFSLSEILTFVLFFAILILLSIAYNIY